MVFCRHRFCTYAGSHRSSEDASRGSLVTKMDRAHMFIHVCVAKASHFISGDFERVSWSMARV